MRNKKIWSSLLGNLFEHYDTALYALLSPFIAPLFFPNQDPVTALILSYSVIPVGMLARPIGAFIFGYIGDTRGRQQALFISLVGMAITSFFMGSVPIFDKIGYFAPACLIVGRMFQNFFGAGETMGGAVYVMENTPEQRRDLMSSVYSASTVGGIIIASLGVSTLCALTEITETWRVLYWIGSITGVFGCFIRYYLPKEEVKLDKGRKDVITGQFKTLWLYRRTMVPLVFAAGFSYSSYSVALVLMNGFIPLVASVSKEQVININTFLLAMDFIILPLFGLLARRYTREKMMVAAAVAAAVSGVPLFMMLEGATLGMVFFVRVCLMLMGLWFSATYHSWAQSLVPSEVRYTVVACSYALGSQIFGGVTAAASLWLYHSTQMAGMAAMYWVLLAIVTIPLVARAQSTVDLKPESA